MANKLNPKQQKFIDFYVRDRNATEAAKAAGYSDKTAYSQGQRLLKHVEIKSEVERRLKISSKQLQNATDLTKEKLLTELLPTIFGDLGDVASWTAEELKLIPSNELDDSLRKSIQSISTTRTTSQFGVNKKVSIKLNDRLRAIEIAAKMMGWIIQKNEHTGKDGEPLANPIDEKKVENILMDLIKGGGKKFE